MFRIYKRLSLIYLFFGCFSLSVHAAPIFGEQNKNIIWQSGLTQFILDEIDTKQFGLNEHPVTLDEKQVSLALEAIEVQTEGGFFSDDEIEPLFSITQINSLTRHIIKALEKASPNQDVTFVIEATSGVLLDLLKERQYTAGRAFFKSGRLNIIIGDYNRARNTAFENMYDSSGNLKPYDYSFGSRTKDSDQISGAVIGIDGVENKRIKKFRYDWFVIDIDTAAKAYIAKVNNKQNPETEGDRQLKREAAKLAKQRREMRAEMARLRKEMQERNGSSDTTSTKSIEERMATLDQLKEKNLITQEEYDTKRKEILNDI